VFVFGVVLFALIAAGVGLLSSPFWGVRFGDWTAVASISLAGAGLIAGGIGFGALLLLALEGILWLLGKYARLHYQLTKPADGGA
jgi:hypothetical protein